MHTTATYQCVVFIRIVSKISQFGCKCIVFMSIKNNVKYDIKVNEIWTNIKIMKLVFVEEELFAFQRLLYQ